MAFRWLERESCWSSSRDSLPVDICAASRCTGRNSGSAVGCGMITIHCTQSKRTHHPLLPAAADHPANPSRVPSSRRSSSRASKPGTRGEPEQAKATAAAYRLDRPSRITSLFRSPRKALPTETPRFVPQGIRSGRKPPCGENPCEPFNLGLHSITRVAENGVRLACGARTPVKATSVRKQSPRRTGSQFSSVPRTDEANCTLQLACGWGLRFRMQCHVSRKDWCGGCGKPCHDASVHLAKRGQGRTPGRSSSVGGGGCRVAETRYDRGLSHGCGPRRRMIRSTPTQEGTRDAQNCGRTCCWFPRPTGFKRSPIQQAKRRFGEDRHGTGQQSRPGFVCLTCPWAPERRFQFADRVSC